MSDSEFNFAKAWAPYESFLATDKLADLIEAPLAYLEEPLIGLVPSIVWVADGARLEAIYLIAEDLYCHVIPGVLHGVRYRDRLEQIRWFLREERVTIDGKEVTLQSALCEIAQYGERTTLSYVGENRAAWLEAARAAFPAWLVRR